MESIDILEQVSQLKKYTSDEIAEALELLDEPVSDCMDENIWKMEKTKKDYMQYDAMHGTYKKRGKEQLEKLRKQTLDKIEKSENPAEAASMAVECAKIIEEGCRFICYNKSVIESYMPIFMTEVCSNMMLQGFSLTDIVKSVPKSMLGDIFHLSEMLGISVEVTEEERRQIKQYDREQEQKKARGNKISMADVWREANREGVLRHDDETGWYMELDGERIEDSVYGIAARVAGQKLTYPYYLRLKSPQYAESFSELLEELMKHSSDFCIDGLEDAYSRQELDMIRKIKEKLESCHVKEEA